MRGLERVPVSVVLDSVGVRTGELLSDERLRADLAAVVATGWFADANVRIEPYRDGVRVVFLVVENPPIAQISVEGNTVINTPEIVTALNVPVGQVLNVIRLRDGARAVEKLYEERGFVLARIADVGVTGDVNARLRVRINEGRVEAVQYKGVVKTQRYVLDRGAVVVPGRVFNVNELNADLQRIFNLELFESIQARPLPGSSPDQVIVEIEVKEQPSQQARFALGYSERTGIVGMLEYTEKNWKGRLEQLSVRYERGLGDRNVPSLTAPVASNFSITYRKPWLDARGTALEASLYEANSTETEYAADKTIVSRFHLNRLGSSIALTRPIDPITHAALKLKSERALVDLLPVDPTVPPCDTDPDDPACPKPPPTYITSGRTVSLQLSGVRDSRDSRTSPTKGERFGASIDLALPLIGSDFSFGKYYLEYTRYIPAGSFTLVGRAAVGFSHGTLPYHELFTLGGPSSLRAYPFGYLRQPTFGLVNLETRVPLGGLATMLKEFVGILYVDVGSAPISSSILLGYGAGISVKTPVGPIRIDYAIGSEGTQTWISIGHPF